ncbi:hypothetical protein RDV89_03445 [Nocardioides zeae]|uniref:Uncharacterized protein n=1 Tax=Nocardioides imazamoxiresistens TaxID=3231893 RepID=A0ABU3PS90_9ACTN|nr:hypothetical protein [Nocardioides zeae]MDT9592104.1 hypothetical protein [Nocardioides zeae]
MGWEEEWATEVVGTPLATRVTVTRLQGAGTAFDVELVPGRGTRWIAVGRAVRGLAQGGTSVSSAFAVEAGATRPTVRLRWRDSHLGEVRAADLPLSAA